MKKSLVTLTAALLISSIALPTATYAHKELDDKKEKESQKYNWKWKEQRYHDDDDDDDDDYDDDDDDYDDDDDDKKERGKKGDAKIAAADRKQLSIDFGGNDHRKSVTQPLDALPAKGKRGSTITWSSSHPSILSSDGKTLNRPAQRDVNVTLTATVKYNKAVTKKKFILTVKKQQMNAQQIVAADKAALQITFSGNDTAANVTSPLRLPAKGVNGSTITWFSSNTSVISHDGKTVILPASGANDAAVVMTAIITNQGVTDSKLFTVTVKQQLSNVQRAIADRDALTLTFSGSDTASSVIGPITLRKTGANGSTITWFSSHPGYISNEGAIVSRPPAASGDAQVILTAIIQNGGHSETKTFTVTLKAQLTDAQKVAADKQVLAIGFSGGDTASRVTGTITLPTLGIHGSTILWISDSPSVISNDGKTVNRPASTSTDAQVKMTAIIVSNGSSEVKTFDLIVKRR
ncbi:immunoglobulin-like domain-containing protein [Paenibacillus abyssi]|uniref:Atrophied bacterial Ig domain-containing protein n=1 Tax=Paenibacillus abyssi TaxID=1340531 RepID=A0A917CZC6_9BACL|nr:immunoglobulin-like domain-containing protein [Paenibacillus abyssi]GGG03879.1 hypothetical protein GCM10010916_21190 [Paenibacillus abyssi]